MENNSDSVRTEKELANIKVTRSLFKRAVGYTYQQIVSDSARVATTKTEPEKVTNMVGTFLNEEYKASFYSS